MFPSPSILSLPVPDPATVLYNLDLRCSAASRLVPALPGRIEEVELRLVVGLVLNVIIALIAVLGVLGGLHLPGLGGEHPLQALEDSLGDQLLSVRGPAVAQNTVTGFGTDEGAGRALVAQPLLPLNVGGVA